MVGSVYARRTLVCSRTNGGRIATIEVGSKSFPAAIASHARNWLHFLSSASINLMTSLLAFHDPALALLPTRHWRCARAAQCSLHSRQPLCVRLHQLFTTARRYNTRCAVIASGRYVDAMRSTKQRLDAASEFLRSLFS
jgi:hypothetical protein